MILFMYQYSFGRCSGITIVDSTMIPMCNNLMRHFNNVFVGLAKSRKAR